MSTVSTVEITNPSLALSPVDLKSVTEYRTLPRVRNCEDQFCADAVCEGCANDPRFSYYVKPGDAVWLQFQLSDYLNPDPEAPIYGWNSGEAGTWWLQLQVMDLDGTVLWEGDIRDLATSFWVGYHEDYGSYQEVVMQVDTLLSELGSDVRCFYFRVKIREALPEYYTADTTWGVAGTPGISFPDEGYTVFNTADGIIYVYQGGAWKGLSADEGEYVYVADSGYWFVYESGVWNGAEPPYDHEAEDFSYCSTNVYTVSAACEGTVQLYASYQKVDCAGFIYEAPQGYFIRSADAPPLVPHFTMFRIKGVLEPISLPLERELTENGRFIRASSSTKYRMATKGVPFNVAKRLQGVFAAQLFTVDQMQFTQVSAIERNNDTGNSWWVDVELDRIDCDSSASCD